MNLSQPIFFLVLLTSFMSNSQQAELQDVKPDDAFTRPKSVFHHGIGQFPSQTTRAAMTCNEYPRVCRISGSPGPDCCGKRCVNVDLDRLNCGRCGNKCEYLEICCKGKCVNGLWDKKHCGGCDKKCKKGSECSFGMCNYA